MSIRVDSPFQANAITVGDRGLGVLASDVPSTGEDGAGYIYDQITTLSLTTEEVYGRITSFPSGGTFFAWEDSSFEFSASDGSYSFTYQLYVDGVATGTTQTVNLVIGSGISGDVSAQESGADTLSATADVEVSANLAAQEVGDDTLASTADVEASANLAAQESGADTLSATGTVAFAAISGDLTAQESGSDSASFTGTLDSAPSPVVPDLGRWSGGTTSLVPTTSWTAPNGLFTTQDRNDNSVYSYDSATSTITLPSTDLADGYLVVGAFVTSGGNDRTNQNGRFIQSSGTGNFVSAWASGYSRNSSNENSYVRTWAFVDSPSAAADIQFQWRRDSDSNNTGTDEAYLEVIPLYYNNALVAESSWTGPNGGTTPNTVSGFTSSVDTDSLLSSGTTATVKAGRKYLILGGWFLQTNSGSRTQRWGGLSLSGVIIDDLKSYAYSRNTNNDRIGNIFSAALNEDAVDTPFQVSIYRGDGVAAGEGGADVDGNTTASEGHHVIVVLELDNAAVITPTNNALETAQYTGTGVSAVDSVNLANTSDYLAGANISAASNDVGSGGRFQAESEIVVDGVAIDHSVAGNYLRNNQGSQDTFGWSSNNLSAVNATAGDSFGVEVNVTGQDEGNPTSPPFWASAWALDLQTLKVVSGGGVSGDLAAQESGSDSFSGTGGLSVSGDLAAQDSGADAFASTGDVVVQGSVSAQEAGQDTLSATGTVAFPAISGDLAAQEAGADSLSCTADVSIAGDLSIQEAGADTFASSADVGVQGTLSVQEAGSDTLSATGTVAFSDISGDLAVQESGSDIASLSGEVEVSADLSAQESGADAISASGEVEVSGDLSAQESGDDTFTATADLGLSGDLSAQETGDDTFSGIVRAAVNAMLAVEGPEAGVLTGSGEVLVQGDLQAQEVGQDTFTGTSVSTSTGSLIAQEAGDDAASGSGEVEVSADLSAQEAGADTPSFTGDVDVSADLAAQEVGEDELVSTADVFVAGDLATQEAGQDDLAVSADVAVSGDLIAQEVGQDTFTGITESTTAGSLQAQEAGADALSANGEVEVSADLAAQEAGADTASFSGTVAFAGDLLAQEDGEDDLSSTVEVRVSGDASALEAGPDSALIEVGVIVEGDLAALEAGQDTADFSGLVFDPSREGDLAAVEAGEDTFTSTGSLVVSGEMTVSEGLLVASVTLDELLDEIAVRLGDDCVIARKMLTNRVEISSDNRVTTVYDDDGTTPLKVFDHADERNRVPR